jgi:hypothetical protein
MAPPNMNPERHLLNLITAAMLWVSLSLSANEPSFDQGPHWAFIAPVKSSVAHSIDQLLAHQHSKMGLVPQGQADAALWLRRVYLDLTGLPPSLKEQQDFAQQDSMPNRRKIVDALLASPHHGERWGRNFMDIWRYSDWYGLGNQLRYSQKHIWHWRDWIVESLNKDLGYDTMLQQMLAGDELAPENPDVLRATGFLARNYYLFNRTTWLDDTIEHTSKAFLGLTMNCVKCHAHKYDPITHDEYYAMRAIFEPYHVRLDAIPSQTDLEKDGLPRVYDLHLTRKTHLHIKGDEKNPDPSRDISPGVPAVLGFKALEIHPVKLSPQAAQSTRAKAITTIGETKKKQTKVITSLKALEGPDETDKTRFLPFPNESTGRRAAFAKWITDRQNPLTARVIVNHLWLRHFGQPLVTNVFDFGRQSKAPPLQEVLDFLAVELMENHWSLKHIHRLIVMSQAYGRTSSKLNAASVNQERDPENVDPWRMSSTRLDAQALRDCLLKLSGRLDTTIGGPTLPANSSDKLARRSLYFNHTRDDSNAFLATFDNANVLDCYRRAESIVPQQALALMNAETSLAAAQKITQAMNVTSDSQFIQDAYQTLLATPPTAEELALSLQGLQQLGATETARAAFIHILLNHQDFITIR